MSRRLFAVVVVAVTVAGALAAVRADGIIIPIPREVPVAQAFKIKYHHVTATVNGQSATVAVDQVFVNPNPSAMEVQYVFPLPEGAALSEFKLVVDGKEVKGELMDRDKARRIYESIVREKRDPALLEYMGRGMFRTSVFPIPGNGERRVALTYQQLLGKDGELVEFIYPLNTEKFSSAHLESVKIELDIRAQTPIRSVYSPTHPVAVQRPGETKALVAYTDKDVLPDSDFRLFFQLAGGDVGATVLSCRPQADQPGYFCLLASPKVLGRQVRPVAKSVLFVLDKSGSMAGRKMEQARDSLKFILRSLHPDDLFNVIVYDSGVTEFAPELQSAKPTDGGKSPAVEKALAFVDAITAGGATNIDAALHAALGMIASDDRPGYVIFLTDGLPTAGVTDERAITAGAASANAHKARLFVFGVGNDVNTRLLDKLASGNRGLSEYVAPAEDIERAVSGFYRKISSPVMTDLAVDFGGAAASQAYPQVLGDLFADSQLVLVGRYANSGPTTVTLSGNYLGKAERFKYPADLAAAAPAGDSGFVEKLWALRRVGYIIEHIQMHGSSQELIDELVRLSTRHGILTEYTAFLVREDVRFGDAGNVRRAEQAADALRLDVGAEAVNQARAKQAYQRATTAAPAAPLAGRGGGSAGPVLTSAGERINTANVRYVGEKVFFLKDGVWRDSAVTDAQAAAAVRIERFSEKFFELVRGQSADVNRYFALTGKVMVRVAGKTWLIE